MMRKCLFGWLHFIYEAINLFISPRLWQQARKQELWKEKKNFCRILCGQYRSLEFVESRQRRQSNYKSTFIHKHKTKSDVRSQIFWVRSLLPSHMTLNWLRGIFTRSRFSNQKAFKVFLFRVPSTGQLSLQRVLLQSFDCNWSSG